MPLDRSWFNTLVDDDGSNTTGSVWDTTDVDALMDAVDVEIALVPRLALGDAVFLELTGAVNDWAGSPEAVIWEVFPQAGAYLTGIVAPARMGTQHLLLNQGNPLQLYHQNPNSAAAHQLVCPGYANYLIPSWTGIWMYYSSRSLKWVFYKP